MSKCVTIELEINNGTYVATYKGGTDKNGKFNVGNTTDCVCFLAKNEDCIVHFDEPDFFDPPESRVELTAGEKSDCMTILGDGSTEWSVTQTIATNQKHKPAKRGAARMTTTIMAADSSLAVMVDELAEIELHGNPDPIIKP